MSNPEDDYERALWNNNFYSSPALLTGSASSNHIINLRKSVNLPNSASMQSLHGHVAGPKGDTSKPHSEAGNGNAPDPAANANNGTRSGFTQGSRTSLMKVSPSMKALENVLNGDKGAVNSPDVIAEEEEEEEKTEVEDPQTEPIGQLKEAFYVPQNSDEYRGKTLDRFKQGPGSKSTVYGDHGSSQELARPNIDYEQPGLRASLLSLQTFHTANSGETIKFEGALGQAFTPRQNSTDGQMSGRTPSVTTIEYPAYPENDGTPTDAALPSFLSTETEDQGIHLQKAAVGSNILGKGHAERENSVTQRVPGPNKPADSQPNNASISSGKSSGTSRTGVSKTMVPSSSCPVLFDNYRPAPRTPRDEKENSPDSGIGSAEKTGTNKREDLSKKASMLPEKSSAPVKTSPLKQAPVRSLLDSPFSATPKPKNKPPTLQQDQKQKPHEVSKKESPKKSSSAFATPRSKAASMHESPRKSHSDVGVPHSPSFATHHRSATTDGGAYQSSSVPDAKTNKRFSFRGLFKMKSKNHSLSKLKEIDEELKHGSRPVKLSSKSYSTPNMSALVSEQKEKEREEVKRKEREKKREKESQQAIEIERKKENEKARNAQTKKGKENAKQAEKNTEPVSKPESRVNGKKRLFGLKANDYDESTTKSSTALNSSARSRKSLDSEEVVKTPRTVQPSVEQEPAEPTTPAMAASVFSAETPSTSYLDSKRNTIREVDDSDYSPDLTKNSQAEGLSAENVDSTPTEAPKAMHMLVKSSPESEAEDISPYMSQPPAFNSSLASNSPTQFGSPFRVSFPAEGATLSPRPPINLHLQPPPSPNRALNKRTSNEYLGGESNLATNLRFQPPQSPSRSVSSRISSEQLVGETLFPKYLDANEVESIVSLERSRSMRSIKSTNKRSSFLNYNGSDENIILGKNLTVPPQTSMKRSGSILKNSPSLQSVRPDMFHSIDTAFANIPSPPPPPPQETVVDEEPVSYDDNDYVDFIEFSDYIDYENLDFASSPLPESYKEPVSDSPSPILGLYAQAASGDTEFLQESNEPEPSFIEKPQVPTLDTTPVIDSSTAVDTTTSFDAAGNEKSITELHQEVSVPRRSPEIFHVTSHTDSEFDTSKAVSEDLNANTNSIDPTPTASPLNNTFKFATENAQRGDSSSTNPRPVSMSFKGFSGSAFKDRMLPYSGSHQSINFEENFENSSVGQGFGSSDEESDDDSISYEADEDYTKFHTVSESRQPEKGPKPTNSFERRQQHIKNVLDLQPPSQSLPFHHDRIPSISDQSSISSPKSLTSFITRMRKSPMSSPKLAPQKNSVKFSSRIILYDTYHHDEYDRHPEIATCNQLTPLLAQQIKEELNELKANMEVHAESACYTQFF